MLTADLINNSIPRLQLQDTVSKSLQLLADYRLTHLPVAAEEKYLGLISEDDLLDSDDPKQTIESLQEFLLRDAVHVGQHFLTAVNYTNKYDSSIVPVINHENDLVGVITHSNLLLALGNFSGATEIGGIIVLEMDRLHFSISEISRIVESNDATVLHLNTTTHPETGMLTVTLHLNKREISAILASFERYEYDVIYSFGDESISDEIEGNYLHLMNYLDI